jgi:hypothetical protein
VNGRRWSDLPVLIPAAGLSFSENYSGFNIALLMALPHIALKHRVYAFKVAFESGFPVSKPGH